MLTKTNEKLFAANEKKDKEIEILKAELESANQLIETY
jgi:hypothetical protein